MTVFHLQRLTLRVVHDIGLSTLGIAGDLAASADRDSIAAHTAFVRLHELVVLAQLPLAELLRDLTKDLAQPGQVLEALRVDQIDDLTLDAHVTRRPERLAGNARRNAGLDHGIDRAHAVGPGVDRQLAEIELVHSPGQQAVGGGRIDVLLAQDAGHDIVEVVPARELAPGIGRLRGPGALLAALAATALLEARPRQRRLAGLVVLDPLLEPFAEPGLIALASSPARLVAHAELVRPAARVRA